VLLTKTLFESCLDPAQVARSGRTTLHQGGMYVGNGGLTVDLGGLTSNTQVSIAGGGAAIDEHLQVRAGANRTPPSRAALTAGRAILQRPAPRWSVVVPFAHAHSFLRLPLRAGLSRWPARWQ
jgi:hypothetical protein